MFVPCGRRLSSWALQASEYSSEREVTTDVFVWVVAVAAVLMFIATYAAGWRDGSRNTIRRLNDLRAKWPPMDEAERRLVQGDN